MREIENMEKNGLSCISPYGFSGPRLVLFPRSYPVPRNNALEPAHVHAAATFFCSYIIKIWCPTSLKLRREWENGRRRE